MSASAKDRFYEIDLLRFLAALAVVLYHYVFRGFAQGGYSPVEYPVLGEFFKYGTYGVQLFFIISGFVILMTASKRDAAGFVISRLTRLYPAFWTAVTLTALCAVVFALPLFDVSLPQYLANLTMLNGFVGIPHVDGVYWTLVVELKFYVLIFVLLICRQIPRIEWFLIAWAALTVADVFLPLPKLLSFAFLTDYSVYFIAGAVFYLIHDKGVSLQRMLLLWVSYVVALLQDMAGLDEFNSYYNTDASVLITSALITLFFVCFLAISLGYSKAFRMPAMVKLGVLTYPLYLIHQNIGFMIYQSVGESFNRYTLLIGLLLLVILLSWLIHRLVEQPLGLKMNQWLKAQWTKFASGRRALA